jgi:hypothetical protein
LVADVARQLTVSTSLIYNFRWEFLAREPRVDFFLAVLVSDHAAAAVPLDKTAITVELSNERSRG